MTRLRWDKARRVGASAVGPSGRDGDIKAICCDCGYDEEWGRGPPTTRPRRLLRCLVCGSRAGRLEWQPPGRGPKKFKPVVIYSQKPDGAAKA
jgi:hypothetical protein